MTLPEAIYGDSMAKVTDLLADQMDKAEVKWALKHIDGLTEDTTCRDLTDKQRDLLATAVEG